MIYKLIVQNEDRTQLKQYDIKCTELRKKNNVYDSLNINNKGEIYYHRRISYYQGETSILSEEEIRQIGEITIELFEGINYLYLLDDTSSILSIKYILKNDFTDAYTSQVEMRSEISQEASRINAVVKKIVDDEGEVTGASLLLAINGDESEAKLQADKIALEGYTTINGNFAVDLEGNMYANNGTFTGNIYLQDGKKVLGGAGLLTNIQDASNLELIGFLSDMDVAGRDAVRTGISVEVYIPKGFEVQSAHCTFIHSPVNYQGESTSSYNFWGYARQVGLYKNISEDYSMTIYDHAESDEGDNSSYSEIEGAFGENGFTPEGTPTDEEHPTQKVTSIDISRYIDEGLNSFRLLSNIDAPTTVGDYIERNIYNKTGRGYAVINVIGYMKFKEENQEDEEDINIDEDIDLVLESEDNINDLEE